VAGVADSAPTVARLESSARPITVQAFL
jgi:hypothetical protein